MPYSRADFERSVKCLIGEKRYYEIDQMPVVDKCKEVAIAGLLHETNDEEYDSDAAWRVIRATAKNLWRGDGTHGLSL